MTDKQALTEVNNRIDRVLSECPQVMRPMMGHLKDAKGKGIRALLIIQAANGLISGGNEPFDNEPLDNEFLSAIMDETIDFAAAVELLHLATLIHDDIIDNAIMRRGVTSLQYEFGKKSAVLTGDFLFTKCYNLVSRSGQDRMEHFVRSIGNICAGEMLQHEFNRDYDITEKQYFKIIAGKTAILFASSLYNAALICNAGETAANRLFRAGYYMGMVFQMIDDCLDYDGDEATVKKTLGKDLEEGFVTHPLICAMKKDPAIKEILKERGTKKLRVADKKKVYSLVKKSGAVAGTKEAAKRFCSLAQKYVNLALPNQSGSKLLETLELIYSRKG